MRVPELIIVEVVSADAGEFGNLIVQIKIVPRYKNPYCIFLPKTDGSGKSEIRREDFIGQFDDHLEIGLMDYAGSLDLLGPMVEMSLFDDGWWHRNKRLVLAWPLLTNEKGNWSSRREHYDYMASSNNRAFECRPVKVNLHETATVRLPVTYRT